MVTDTNRETVHTVIAICLIASGVAAFFLDLVWIEEGDVNNGTLAYIGEAFTLAGALLGIVQYVQGKFSSFAKSNNLKNPD